MADLSVLNDILSTRNTLVAIASIMAVALWRGWTGLPAVMQQWIAHRQEVSARKDKEWKRLSDEVDKLSRRHDECEEKLAAEREARHADVSQLRDDLNAERAARIEKQAMLDGQGEVRQAAEVAAAMQRLDPDKAPESLKAAERVRRIRSGEDGDGI